jgi:hypothetical protein
MQGGVEVSYARKLTGRQKVLGHRSEQRGQDHVSGLVRRNLRVRRIQKR